MSQEQTVTYVSRMDPLVGGSPGRTRTNDKAVNSRLLYQLSYRGSSKNVRIGSQTLCTICEGIL